MQLFFLLACLTICLLATGQAKNCFFQALHDLEDSSKCPDDLTPEKLRSNMRDRFMTTKTDLMCLWGERRKKSLMEDDMGKKMLEFGQLCKLS
ncbi:hypothetical protein D915_007622 [Fasciola hepatica]|uniref:Uncharacterized protein n=1 Tax=Fasciola hepatica TaxID=6192 RepID=A0A4E0R5V5_FASHE|nr:hypothetical protein D915_007622 [Fasciola hepatica]